MSPTYFNSLDPVCKTPFGAVAAGQAVTFRLTVPESLGYVDPHLVLTKDHEDPVHYRMEFAGQTPQQNHFTFTIAPARRACTFTILTCTPTSAASTVMRAARVCCAGPTVRTGS